MNNDNKIAGLSPGPMYMPLSGKRVAIPSYSKNPPAYGFGGTYPVIDKRFSPAPSHYVNATAPNLGRQKIDSTTKSLPEWGMGTGTREQRNMLHIDRSLASNNSANTLVFNGGISSGPVTILAATKELAPSTTTSAASRECMGRALAVAMAAEADHTPDKALAGALRLLHQRVATLKAQGSVGSGAL